MNHRTLATCALHISLSARYRSINGEYNKWINYCVLMIDLPNRASLIFLSGIHFLMQLSVGEWQNSPNL